MRLWWLLVVANTACLRSTSFHCTHDSQCDPGGRCEDIGYCSFADPNCPDGRRFGDLSDSVSNICVGQQPGIDAGIDAPPVFVTIGGTVSGLTGTGLALRDNTTDMLSVTASGPFTVATKLVVGSRYDVTIATPPAGQDAYLARASGTANAPITSVLVSCFPAGSDPGVRCDSGIFCTGGQTCCFDKTSGSGTCGVPGCTKITMPCDSANECNGGMGVCCAHYHNGSGLNDVGCVASPGQCSAAGGGTVEILCDSRDATPCQGGQTCTGSSMLGAAYHTCK